MPIYLTGAAEPVGFETLESDGPIKPSAAILNIHNRKYSRNSVIEIEANTGAYFSIIGDGSNDVWACGAAGVIDKYDYSAGNSTRQTTPGTPNLHAISSGDIDELVAVGQENAVVYYTSNGGATWSSASTWGTIDHDLNTVDHAKNDKLIVL